MNEVYLGDSVYARMVDGMIELTTRNGLPTDPSNTIFLEYEVFKCLQTFVEQQKAEHEKA
jgi:hypothetical protein